MLHDQKLSPQADGLSDTLSLLRASFRIGVILHHCTNWLVTGSIGEEAPWTTIFPRSPKSPAGGRQSTFRRSLIFLENEDSKTARFLISRDLQGNAAGAQFQIKRSLLHPPPSQPAPS